MSAVLRHTSSSSSTRRAQPCNVMGCRRTTGTGAAGPVGTTGRPRASRPGTVRCRARGGCGIRTVPRGRSLRPLLRPRGAHRGVPRAWLSRPSTARTLGGPRRRPRPRPAMPVGVHRSQVVHMPPSWCRASGVSRREAVHAIRMLPTTPSVRQKRSIKPPICARPRTTSLLPKPPGPVGGETGGQPRPDQTIIASLSGGADDTSSVPMGTDGAPVFRESVPAREPRAPASSLLPRRLPCVGRTHGCARRRLPDHCRLPAGW